MVIIQKCVVCGIDVDVDNCFGVISEGETFCNEHAYISNLLDEFERMGVRIINLQRQYKVTSDLLNKKLKPYYHEQQREKENQKWRKENDL